MLAGLVLRLKKWRRKEMVMVCGSGSGFGAAE